MSNRQLHGAPADVTPNPVTSGLAPASAASSSGPSSTGEQQNAANKRAALAGQWRTPPLPVFPTSAGATTAAMPHPVAPAAPTPAPPPLPDNSEEYAKALQEAYRRGAEAAAAMHARQQHHQHHHQQQQQQHPQQPQPPQPPQQQPQQIVPSVSCPNFQIPTQLTMATTPGATAPPPQAQPAPQATIMTSASQATIMTSRSDEMPTYVAQPPPQPATTGGPTPVTAAPTAPPPTTSAAAAPTYVPQAPPPTTYVTSLPPQAAVPSSTASAAPGPVVPNPLSNMPPPPKPPPKAAAVAAPGVMAVAASNPQQRSLSLPDMTSYAVQAEEEKRQKRLARNRASARLRRLRKKNLVDAYETEVGILEKTLQQLKAHEWGTPSHPANPKNSYEKSHHSLMEALSMERGQQDISAEQRAQQCQDILEQQLQQLDLLREVQLEQEFLAAVASSEGTGDQVAMEDGTGKNEEFNSMVHELRDILQLTDDQMAKMQDASKGLKEEVAALDTVFSSLSMMKENEWLLNQGVQEITDQMTSIMHKNQMSKFLLWADANVEAIDQLDHVHALPEAQKQQQILQGPIFTFGVETTPIDEDESKGQ